MRHVVSELLGWPGGILLGNLIVDTLFAIPQVIGYVRLHRKIDTHHKWHTDQHGSLKD